ncbi:YcbK family protein [Variovorax sp. RA8]|uniref:YcbK family protein n=1 Tax=Variovorax sp. (strain JCM 16519 / RA8) TaxID=662548 RepID=UPI001317DF46|nr:DUF882 domain-containing protein [Variovorax sp. RA8]VTU44028.1 Peptidase M15 [Variovorax sp. RA8]
MLSPNPYVHPEGTAPSGLPAALTRRAALRGLGGLGLGSILLLQDPGVAHAQASAAAAGALPSAAQRDEFWTRDRTVWVRRTSTGEVIKSTYWRNGQLVQSEYERLCWFARDTTLERLIREDSPHIRRALDSGRFTREQISQWTMMNPIIFDVHYAITSWLGWFNMARPIDWTSAFRHPITNSITEGSARDSWHMRGGAVDARIPGVPIEQFGRFAQWLGAGGVGVYVGKSFTHTDSGRVRAWRA